jgi:glucose dehydrogenase
VRLRSAPVVGEWRAYNGNYASTRYSPLDQINQDTVKNLKLVTKTLVFMGEGIRQAPPGSGGKKFRAFDKATGQVVWETELDGASTGVPMTYFWQGKQYIVVPIGWQGHPGEFVALALN